MTIRLSTIDDLVTALPYLVGFEPESSAVLVCVQGGVCGDILRVDLPRSTRDNKGWLDIAERATTRRARDQVLLAAFTDDPARARVLGPLERRLRAAGVDVPHVVVVGATSYRHLSCAGSSCCPLSGRPRAGGASLASSIAAEFVVQGCAPVPTRGALEATLAPDLGARARVEAAADAGPLGFEVMRWCQVARTSQVWEPTDLDRWRLGLSLLDRNWRDALIDAFAPDCYLGPDALPGRHAAAIGEVRQALRAGDVGQWRAQQVLISRLTDLARQVPAELAAGTYTVLAMTALASGQGALANIALDQASTADPDYVLASMAARMLAHGVAPVPPRMERADVR
ncbi:MAG: DUF4192 domain-containing protein [Tetrasphaera jenkinsii]|jgi:hypothetical protein|nr:DUF4192 domain-containing protein [Tetrasphaera jenkinsii]